MLRSVAAKDRRPGIDQRCRFLPTRQPQAKALVSMPTNIWCRLTLTQPTYRFFWYALSDLKCDIGAQAVVGSVFVEPNTEMAYPRLFEDPSETLPGTEAAIGARSQQAPLQLRVKNLDQREPEVVRIWVQIELPIADPPILDDATERHLRDSPAPLLVQRATSKVNLR
jgi:hypothetical protein